MYSPEYGRIQCGVLNCTHQATPIVHKGRDRLKAKQIARFWDRLCQLQDLSTSTLCLLQDLVASTTVTVARSFHRLIVPVKPTCLWCQLEDTVWQAHSLCASHKIFSRDKAHCAGWRMWVWCAQNWTMMCAGSTSLHFSISSLWAPCLRRTGEGKLFQCGSRHVIVCPHVAK